MAFKLCKKCKEMHIDKTPESLGKLAFHLYDTHGIPPEVLTMELVDYIINKKESNKNGALES